MTPIVVIDTGTANLASILAGLRRVGGNPVATTDRNTIISATRLVLPGVGAFRAGMDRLRQLELVDYLRERVAEGRPLLAVCLGLQLLCDSSEESPGVSGLGVIPAAVTRFTGDVRVPQIGFNRVEEGCPLIEPGYAYFANSFCLQQAPAGWSTALSEHGGDFVAALQRGQVLACQFHPELSGRWGMALLSRWLLASAVSVEPERQGGLAC
jgi:glutamine amidotransferase